MKTVKLTVWTSNLATLCMTPVTREYAREHAHDEDLEHLQVEGGYPRDFFFCNNGSEDGAVCLTIEDGGNEQEFETLPIVDFGNMYEVKDEEEKNGEFANETAVRKAFSDDDSYVVAWKTLKALRSGPLSALSNCDYFDYIKKEISEQDTDWDEGGDGVFFVECGSMGKGKVCFEIGLPDGEEFDIGKLHFLDWAYWWESDQAPTLDEFQEAFQAQGVLLEYVEYDGRFIARNEADISPFWKYILCAKFLDAAFHELEGE